MSINSGNTTLALITRAWYLSGIVSRGLQTVSGDQIQDGLDRLNGLLAIKTANMGLIPYFQEYDFTAVIGQQTYFISNLIEAELLTFNIDTVRYSTTRTTRYQYFATPRADNIESLPVQWHFERALGGGNVYLYFLPQETYAMKLWGKFGLASTTLTQDLTTVYEPFYIEYLLYALAEYLCEYYAIEFPAVQHKRLMQYEQVIRDISPLDLTMEKVTALAGNQFYNYANANLGKGFTTVG